MIIRMKRLFSQVTSAAYFVCRGSHTRKGGKSPSGFILELFIHRTTALRKIIQGLSPSLLYLTSRTRSLGNRAWEYKSAPDCAPNSSQDCLIPFRTSRYYPLGIIWRFFCAVFVPATDGSPPFPSLAHLSPRSRYEELHLALRQPHVGHNRGCVCCPQSPFFRDNGRTAVILQMVSMGGKSSELGLAADGAASLSM